MEASSDPTANSTNSKAMCYNRPIIRSLAANRECSTGYSESRIGFDTRAPNVLNFLKVLSPPNCILFATTYTTIVMLSNTSWGQNEPQPYQRFEKTNRIVLDVGESGAFDSTQAKYPCILRVNGRLWMWYNGRTDDHFTGSIGLATSDDGWRWKKTNHGQPVFRHGEPGTFDSTKVDHPSVLHFDGKFHMWYTAGDKNSRYTIGYATSPDGTHWTRANEGRPVLTPGPAGRFDDKVVLHPAVVRDDSGLLHIWYNGVGPQKSFRIGHAVSRNGIHWTRQNNGQPVLEPDTVNDFREGYVYNVFVRQNKGQFHMWYSAWSQNDRTSGPNHNGITHAVSPDGNEWRKDPVPTLTNGNPGSLDDYACFACCIVQQGEEFWMYYSAGSGQSRTRYRVSLAIFRPNR